VKHAVPCLLLLSGCLAEDQPPAPVEYALTWTCLSPEGCERSDEVARIDRVILDRRDFSYHFTSTEEPSFAADAELIPSDSLPVGCYLLFALSLFGHELEPSRICHSAAIFELQLAIPNQDPTTSSMWLVEARDVEVFEPTTAPRPRP
jgi:hypothetical protein